MPNWLAMFCRDERYDIIPNMGGGDCLFLALSSALRKPVSFFRNLVADATPDERYEHLRDLYTQAFRENNRAILADLAFMRHVHSPDALRRFMRTSAYWGDEMAIDAIEQRLGVKLLILDPRRARAGRSPCVFQSTQRPYHPRFYVMLNFTGSHYELITHDGRALFALDDLPLAIYVLFSLPGGNLRSMVHGWSRRGERIARGKVT